MPYHRYLDYLIYKGMKAGDIRSNILGLDYFPPSHLEIEQRRAEIGSLRIASVRTSLGIDLLFDADSHVLRNCLFIVEHKPVRETAERMLAERVEAPDVASVLSFKYNNKIGRESVEAFVMLFWDVWTLTPLDFREYFQAAGVEVSMARAPVPLAVRKDYSSWKEGLVPEMSSEDMIRQIEVDAFMRYNEFAGMRKMDDARADAKLTLTMALARKKNFKAKDETLEGIEFADAVSQAPTLSELTEAYHERD